MKTEDRYLIVVDLDGTLLHNYAEWDDEAIATLKQLNQMGHMVMIATGRPFRSSFFVYQALGLNSPLINYNGALVSHPFDEAFPKTDLRISKDDVFQILDFVGDELINAFCEIHDDIYVLTYKPGVYPYLHADGGILHVGPLQKNLPENPNGCILFVTDKIVDALSDYITKNFSDRLRCRYWGEQSQFNIMEVYNVHTNKGSGIITTANYYGIPKDHIIAIGDGHNDIEMFNEASVRVAMENAHPLLLPYATHITKTNLNQGVTLFLKDFFKDDLAKEKQNE